MQAQHRFPASWCSWRPGHPWRRTAAALWAVAGIGLCGAPGPALSQEQAAATPAPENSDIDAPMFYQLLIGELHLRIGDPGSAYGILLDAANKTRDEQLYRRAADIALQARAGDQALSAAQSWSAAHPQSIGARRYVIQILIALNRVPETGAPLEGMLRHAKDAERAGLIATLPRLYARAADRKAAAEVVEQTLQPYMKTDAKADTKAELPDLQLPSWVAIGRMRLAAQDTAGALQAARTAHALDQQAEGPALLALELLAAHPAEADAIVNGYLAASADGQAVRLAYVRALVNAQRYPDAIQLLESITRAQPTLPEPWLMLGALRVDAKQPRAAETALLRYLELAGAQPGAGAQPDDEDDATPRGVTQAYLTLSQAAEQRRDFAAAQRWLTKIPGAASRLSVQARRASILVKQDRLREAREVIRQVPEHTVQDARNKVLAEAQLLRDAKAWSEAYVLLGRAGERFPDDVEVIYERAMIAEKLNRFEQMESLLRQIMQIKPDYHHAYNALGYTLADRRLRLPEAKQLIQKALELAPNDAYVADSLGWVEFRLGNLDEALRILQQAYRARQDAEIGAHLGEVLWTLGRRDEARSVWRQARQRDAQNETLKQTLARLKVSL